MHQGRISLRIRHQVCTLFTTRRFHPASRSSCCVSYSQLFLRRGLSMVNRESPCVSQPARAHHSAAEQDANLMMPGLIAPGRRIKDGVASMACGHLGVVASGIDPTGHAPALRFATSDANGSRTRTAQQLLSPVLPIELPHHHETKLSRTSFRDAPLAR